MAEGADDHDDLRGRHLVWRLEQIQVVIRARIA
jgi:hypothetical protein